MNYYGSETRAEFYGDCLKQDKVTFNHGNIVYEGIKIAIISKPGSNDIYPTLQNALFGAVKLTKNADIDKCGYSHYEIGFNRRSSFLHPSGGDGQNVIFFRVDMSSSTKIDNLKKDFLILGKCPTQGLEHTLSAEKMYWICLSFHSNGGNSYLCVSVKEVHKFKAKDSEIVATPLGLENISKDWSVDNMKRKLD